LAVALFRLGHTLEGIAEAGFREASVDSAKIYEFVLMFMMNIAQHSQLHHTCWK
jgi:hypothetical protein